MQKQKLYNAFLSLNSADLAAVETIARWLEDEAQLNIWLYSWKAIAGEPTQESMEKALDESEACVVFIGPSGLGPWQNEEMRSAVEDSVEGKSMRVIPAILPGVKLPVRNSDLPRFLRRRIRVYLRDIQDQESLHRLRAGILGIAPGRQPQTATTEIVCPFRGLEVFREEDARFFFGREAVVQSLLEHLQTNRFLAVLGPSGSGKSSVVRAGLIPALEKVTKSPKLLYSVFRPGEKPLRALASALEELYEKIGEERYAENLHSRLQASEESLNFMTEKIARTAQADRIFLVIDQFEELFTLTGDKSERQKFWDRLLSAIELISGPTTIILTMRSDFLGHCTFDLDLNDFMDEKRIQIAPMSREETRRAIEEPAALVGLDYDEGLVDTILDDVTGAAGELPLLEHALAELYEHRKGRRLTLQAYKEIGGIKEGLAKRAEAEYGKLNEIEKEVLHKMFIFHLIQSGEGMATRRRASKEELLAIGGQPAVVEKLIDKWTDEKVRLLTTSRDLTRGQDLVEVVHEALIHKWPRVQEWLKAEQESLRLIHQLRQAMQEWQKLGDLVSGNRLARLEALLEDPGFNQQFSPESEEKKFLAACIAAREKEQQEERERVQAIEEAKKHAEILLARNYWENGRQAMADGNVLLALHFTTEAIKTAPPGEDLCTAAQQDLPEHLLTIRLSQTYKHEALIGAVFSKDATRILTWSTDGSARLWNTQTGLLIGQPMQHREIGIPSSAKRFFHSISSTMFQGAMFSKDETRILTWSDDCSACLWDAKTGSPIGQPLQHEGRINSAVFSKDEKRILTCSDDYSARLWNAKTGLPIVQPMQHKGEVNGAVFSKDETRILTWSNDGTARLWDAKTGTPISQPMQHEELERVNGALFSKNGKRILTWSGEYLGGAGGAYLWEATTGTSIGQPMRHKKSVIGAVFSKDEKRILSWSGGLFDITHSGSARLWDAETGIPIGQPMEHKYRVDGAVFIMDEKRILTWGSGCRAHVWDAKTSTSIHQLHNIGICGVAFSEDKKSLLTWSWDGSAHLWDAKTGIPIEQPMQHKAKVYGAIFSKDPKHILIWSEDGSARLWEVATSIPISQPMQHKGGVNGAAFSKDEKCILTWSGGQDPFGDKFGSARLWETENCVPIGQSMQHKESVNGAVFFQDEKRILSWSGSILSRSGGVYMWEASTGILISQPMHHKDGVNGAVLSKDETRILTWSYDSARLWRVDANTYIGQPMQHEGEVNGAVFSKNETRILTWSEDGTARLWDATTGTPISQPMQHEEKVNGGMFSKDGTCILTWSRVNLKKQYDNSGSARLWEAKTGIPIGQPMQHEEGVFDAVFSEDEKRILTSSADGSVRLWESATGILIGQPMQHKGYVKGAVFSKDEKRILAWGSDARLWDVETGILIGQPMKHMQHGVVDGTLFSRDEKRILTWGDDTARLWEVETGIPIGESMQHKGRVKGAVFSKDEKRILTWSDDGTARLWDVPGDLDFPKDKYVLQVQALTGTKFDPATRQITVIPIDEWRKIQQEWQVFAREHAKTCQYKRQNVYLRFWGKDK